MNLITHKQSVTRTLILAALFGASVNAGAQQQLPTDAQADYPVLQPADQPKAAHTISASVQAAMLASGKLAAEVHGLEAQMYDASVRFGEMLPTVDLRGSTGRERSHTEDGDTRIYTPNSYGIEARQNLFNGFGSQARYLGSHSDAMAQYYRILESANSIALEGATAHVNVSRFLTMTKLAEDNVTYHRVLLDRIEEKVSRGVARPADLEQARSRYTLALSNLASEKANTFTALADYQKSTDLIWPVDTLGNYAIETNFEIDNTERLLFALNNHQLLKSANAKLEAARYAIEGAREGYYPRIDLRAKADRFSNYLSSDEEREIASVDLLASMNLYRGGSDEAAEAAAVRRKHQAMDQKLVTCRAIRRNTQVALYDVRNLEKRVNYFKEQAQAITAARAAYQQQFQVGRRELLDLLNAENEFYQAQRNLISVEADLSISKLRLLAASGQLITLFGVEDLIQAEEPAKRQVILYQEQTNTSDVDSACPSSLISLKDFELPTIGFEPALKGVQQDLLPLEPAPQPQATLQAIELAQVGQPVGFRGPGETQEASIEQADPAEVSKRLIRLTKDWATAWQARDINNYINFYSPSFSPEEGSYETWQSQRRERIAAARNIEITVSDIQVIPAFEDPSIYEISFIQHYKAAHYREKSRKVLTWKEHRDGSWQIIREQNLPEDTAYKTESSLLAKVQEQ